MRDMDSEILLKKHIPLYLAGTPKALRAALAKPCILRDPGMGGWVSWL